MAKKDISTILKSGTPKQRILLIAEQIARSKFYGTGDPLLTDREFNQLSDSFKSDKEIKLWNRYKNIDAVVTNAIMNLQGLKYEVLMHYTNLRGYVFLWNNLEHSELLVNSVLHEIKDPEERKRIAERAVKSKGINALFSKNFIDEEGYVETSIDFLHNSYKDEDGNRIDYKDIPRETREGSLFYLIETVKEDAIRSASKWLGWYEALNDYIDSEGFNLKTYKNILETLEGEVRSRVVGWGKYYGEIEVGVDINPKLTKLIEGYNVCPEPYDIDPDEREYNWFKREIIENE